MPSTKSSAPQQFSWEINYFMKMWQFIHKRDEKIEHATLQKNTNDLWHFPLLFFHNVNLVVIFPFYLSNCDSKHHRLIQFVIVDHAKNTLSLAFCSLTNKSSHFPVETFIFQHNGKFLLHYCEWKLRAFKALHRWSFFTPNMIFLLIILTEELCVINHSIPSYFNLKLMLSWFKNINFTFWFHKFFNALLQFFLTTMILINHKFF